MTKYEEAIDHYKYGISHDIFKEPVTSYAKLAVVALDKQIPKTPISKSVSFSEVNWWYCPTCNITICCVDHYLNRCNYCECCGQALDWSELP